MYREATTQPEKDVLKGTHWLLLKSKNNLYEERDESGRLLQALQLNRSLAVAYYLKDDLNELWEQPAGFVRPRAAAACLAD